MVGVGVSPGVYIGVGSGVSVGSGVLVGRGVGVSVGVSTLTSCGFRIWRTGVRAHGFMVGITTVTDIDGPSSPGY